MIVLTEHGKREIAHFIGECAAKRKEILDARLDTADNTELPTEEDIISDMEHGCGIDDDGIYLNAWAVTDNYDSDAILSLVAGKDFEYVGEI